MARLATHVHVADDDGRSHVFGPDDEVPTWAQKKITNEDAWDVPPRGLKKAAAAAEGEPQPTPGESPSA